MFHHHEDISRSADDLISVQHHQQHHIVLTPHHIKSQNNVTITTFYACTALSPYFSVLNQAANAIMDGIIYLFTIRFWSRIYCHAIQKADVIKVSTITQSQQWQHRITL